MLNSIDAVQTAAELRRQLHTMKANDQREVGAAAEAANIPPVQKFLKSHWATSIATGLATFLLLYLANPVFVQEPPATEAQKYMAARPSLRRVSAWSILAALIVAIGPLIYQRFTK